MKAYKGMMLNMYIWQQSLASVKQPFASPQRTSLCKAINKGCTGNQYSQFTRHSGWRHDCLVHVLAIGLFTELSTRHCLEKEASTEPSQNTGTGTQHGPTAHSVLRPLAHHHHHESRDWVPPCSSRAVQMQSKQHGTVFHEINMKHSIHLAAKALCSPHHLDEFPHCSDVAPPLCSECLPSNFVNAKQLTPLPQSLSVTNWCFKQMPLFARLGDLDYSEELKGHARPLVPVGHVWKRWTTHHFTQKLQDPLTLIMHSSVSTHTSNVKFVLVHTCSNAQVNRGKQYYFQSVFPEQPIVHKLYTITEICSPKLSHSQHFLHTTITWQTNKNMIACYGDSLADAVPISTLAMRTSFSTNK